MNEDDFLKKKDSVPIFHEGRTKTHCRKDDMCRTKEKNIGMETEGNEKELPNMNLPIPRVKSRGNPYSDKDFVTNHDLRNLYSDQYSFQLKFYNDENRKL